MQKNGAAKNGAGNGKLTFCVVESDAAVRAALSAPLHAMGVDAHGFVDAAEFLLSGHSHTCQGLIAEWSMRGMTGQEFLRALGAAARPFVTIFTVKGDEEVAAVAALPGVTAVLKKPIAQQELLQVVRIALTRST
ncbi:response regulator [Aquabacterium soli]|jgi:FixJ family two-component response regulator|uniref:Response regulator n=1 Tax=Aquabacterium soli TaxID=2493092 RepID=A0A3R8S7R6_9BURK|nr:response regulator [Aquabacterium soli]RRS04419.1 response regulator [Aquabacterium soli]